MLKFIENIFYNKIFQQRFAAESEIKYKTVIKWGNFSFGKKEKIFSEYLGKIKFKKSFLHLENFCYKPLNILMEKGQLLKNETLSKIQCVLMFLIVKHIWNSFK